jgi:hypothetical protein
MKTLRFRHMLWGALALGVLLVALGIFALRSEWGLNELMRPRLEQLAAARLQAELTIGRLAWEEHRLVISEVRLQRAGHYRIVLPRTRLTLSLRDLLQRHVTALELSSPDIELFPAPANDSDPSTGLPGEPPLTIGRIEVRDARLRYAHEQRPLTLSNVQLSVHGDAAFQFALSGQLAGAAPVPFALAGSGRWRAGLHMTLSTISWNGRKLLREPLTLALPAGGGAQLDLSLGLEALARADLERWLAASCP